MSAEPLTPEEEADLRLFHKSDLHRTQDPKCLLCAAFATLDAERAARPGDGLREAAQAVVDYRDEYSILAGDRWTERAFSLIANLRAALAAPRDPAPAPALDVAARAVLDAANESPSMGEVVPLHMGKALDALDAATQAAPALDAERLKHRPADLLREAAQAVAREWKAWEDANETTRSIPAPTALYIAAHDLIAALDAERAKAGER